MKIDKAKHLLEEMELEAFMDMGNIPPLDETHIQNLLENPPMLCEGGCSDEEGTCKCIRTVFKHYTHYQHYLALIKNDIELAFVDLLNKGR